MKTVSRSLAGVIASSLAITAHAQTSVLEGKAQNVALDPTHGIVTVGDVGCVALTISGVVQIKAKPQPAGAPKPATIYCQTITFAQNARIETFDDLNIRASRLVGKVWIRGMRDHAGTDSSDITAVSATGGPGGDGPGGGNGDDAHGPGYSLRYPGGKSSSSGGDGGPGQAGAVGAGGGPANGGSNGENNVSVQVQADRMDAVCPEITSNGGLGGRGGNGQAGGGGGNGGRGGNGGKGGDSAPGHDGSPGGNGGNGGNGGDGGNGGTGGDGGRGGDGGNLTMIVGSAVPKCSQVLDLFKNIGGVGGNPGIGGAGGPGGLGGSGGAGGSGGSDTRAFTIRINDGARSGYDGVRGNDGRPGLPGQNGKFGQRGMDGKRQIPGFYQAALPAFVPITFDTGSRK